MESCKLLLRHLLPDDEASFKNAITAFQHGHSSFEFAFYFDESIPFADYIKKIEGWSLGKGLPEKFVPNTFLVGVAGGQIVGRLSLRHHLNDFLERVGGHIGYGVVPSCRNRGYATEMLRQALPICASLGIPKVLVTCDLDNPGSQRVIEKCGGIFEGLTNDPQLAVQKRRYWISINHKVIR